jgi:hypothetical protein
MVGHGAETGGVDGGEAPVTAVIVPDGIEQVAVGAQLGL